MKRKIKTSADGFPSAEALYARYHSHLSLTDCKSTGTYKKSPYLHQKIGATYRGTTLHCTCSPIRNVNDRLHLLNSV